MERVNVIVGRFQPFTLGHIKGAEYILDIYKLKTVFCIVETPESKLDKKHPFPSDVIIKNNEDIKEKWFAGMFPIKNADIGKIAQVCREHNYEPVMWTCGSDRVEAYKKQAVVKYINMYNLDPDFKVVEIPRTDDDISATKVRNAILKDDFSTFKRMMPEWSYKYFDSYKPFIKEAKSSTIDIMGLMDISEYLTEKLAYTVSYSKLGNAYKYIVKDDFKAEILSFDNPSQYGIDEGRISKLFIHNTKTDEIVCNYDRGWDVKPTNDIKSLYDEIIKQFN